VLDEEVSRLPDKYRVAIVLCDLEGKSHKEAARQLGWPQGTLSGRLARGRKLLADRLTRRGLAISSGVLAGILSQHAASASVPPSLVSSTVKAASLLAAGQAAVAGFISVRAAALMKGVILSMLLNKIKTMMLSAMLAATVGGAGLVYRTQAGEPGSATKATEAQATKGEPTRDTDAELASSEPSGRSQLSSNPLPRPALVGLEKGQLVVRTLDVAFEPTAVQAQGQTHTTYQKVEILKSKHYFTDMVKVYDVSGKSIAKRELPRLLKKETVALVSSDAEATDPLNLCLFKDGTLLFVLPSSPPPPVAPAAGVTYFPAPQPTVPPGAAIFSPPVAPSPTGGKSPIDSSLPGPRNPSQDDPEVQEFHGRNVRVPVHVLPEQRTSLQQLNLFASADKGKTWERVESISPDKDSFVFCAPKDGLYWLVVQTIGRDGKVNPSKLTEDVRPQHKLWINTGNSR
jgi:Sigma-70, region 4